jgi:hypothetical protein
MAYTRMARRKRSVYGASRSPRIKLPSLDAQSGIYPRILLRRFAIWKKDRMIVRQMSTEAPGKADDGTEKGFLFRDKKSPPIAIPPGNPGARHAGSDERIRWAREVSNLRTSRM